jgi:competence protein ComEA
LGEAIRLPSVLLMRADGGDIGTAAERLPLVRDRLPDDAEALVERGWVPRQPQTGLPSWTQPWLHPGAARHLGWVVVAAVVLLAGSAWVLLHRPSAPRPAPVAAVPAATAPAPDLRIVVDVGGRVRHPGLVTLSAGARVADALRAAGGALRSADVATVDLAARVSDGQLLLIGIPQPAAPSGAASSAPVSLSSATVDELDALPVVGPVLAKRIVDWRESHGGFTSLSQLQQVPGVGPRTYERLKTLVVL